MYYKNLPFDYQSFDIVVDCAILHHLPERSVQGALKEAYRVLKPNSSAVFTDPKENSVIFNFLQNMIPVDKLEAHNCIPSILNKIAWKKHLSKADDRALSNKELTTAKENFTAVDFTYYIMFIRLRRLWRNAYFGKILTTLLIPTRL